MSVTSEIEKINGNKYFIVCFGGIALKMGGIIPFEFVNYVSSIYTNVCDLIFYIDKNQCLYHNGIESISNNIDETVVYLKEKIGKHKYDKVIFMGTSAGGYAAILFGSLCNVTNVISFIPPTKLISNKYTKYRDLKDVINSNTRYILYGDTCITNINDCHHISHCENLKEFTNIKINAKLRSKDIILI